MGRDAKSIELAKAKADYALEITKPEPKLSMMAVGKKVTEKFGQSLAPNRLREAFLAGGGSIQYRGKRRSGKPQVAASTNQASLKAERQRVRSAGQAAPKCKSRRAGRRKADKTAAKATRTLNDAHKHVVVIRAGDLQVQGFHTTEQAKQFISAELAGGTAVGNISFYTRQPIEVNVGI